MEKFSYPFYKLERTKPNVPFLFQPFGEKWESWTYAEVGQMARKLATGLQSFGLPPKSHVGLVSKNCREWLVADIAIAMAGYVSVPFFPTLTGDQIAQVLELGDVKALIAGKMEVWDDMKTGIPDDMPLVAMPHYKGNSKIDRGHQWHEFIEKFEPIEKVAELDMEDIWTIIFTSGTTGTPKGVVLPYRVFNASKIPVETTNEMKVDVNGDNRFFSYLPLNHIAERVVVECTALFFGGEVYFPESLETFAKNLSSAKPTAFFGVPRIYTKFQQAVLGKMPQKKLNTLLQIPIVSGFIKKKLRTALGLNDARIWISGAAPLPEEVKQWYRKIGVNITNGYGMTENCAICSFLIPETSKPGSVGKPHPESKIKIDEATGEILNKSPYVMNGYYKDPVKTAEVLQDGWLRTGDQGFIDSDGDLHITGRVKDTFKTTKGEFIIPSPIEAGYGSNTDIEQICVCGMGCPQPIALVSISETGSLKSKEALIESLEATMNEVNKNLKNYERVSTIVVTKDPWTVENGLVTPTLKVKRNMMNQRFNKQMHEWEKADEKVIFES